MIKNILKVLVSNFFIVLLGSINSFLLPIIMNIEGYAYYNKFLLYVSYINICHLGIPSGMLVNYSGHSYKSINKGKYKSEISLLIIVLCFFSFSMLGFSLIIKNNIVFMVALIIIPYCMVGSYKALYQAWDRFSEYAIINALPNILISIVIIFLYFFFNVISIDIVIISYVMIYFIITVFILYEYIRDTKHIKIEKIFSRENINTTKVGFLITAGNYINLLFHAVDKQFVNNLYSIHSFAMYSFAMSAQNIMTIFITALSQPFYPRLARGDVSKEKINLLKEVLFMFGSLSGCAYFAIAFIVENFIIKYKDSLNIIQIFFVVFPAMAVINVIYINLYKVTMQIRRYILTLLGILGVSIILNLVAVLVRGDYLGISFATMLVYYIWLFYSQNHFDNIKISKRDIIYLIGFITLYVICTVVFTSILGFIIYIFVVMLWNVLMYRETIRIFIDLIYKRYNTRRKRKN